MELPVAVVQIEPVLEGGVVLLELVAPADDVEIGTPVAVGVEEHRVDVLTQAVDLERALRAVADRAVAPLDEEPAGLPLGASHADVVTAVAVHVSDGQGRPFG